MHFVDLPRARFFSCAPLPPSQRVSYASHTCGVVVVEIGSSTQILAQRDTTWARPLSKKDHDTCMNPMHESSTAIVLSSDRTGGMCRALPRALYRIGTCVWRPFHFSFTSKVVRRPVEQMLTFHSDGCALCTLMHFSNTCLASNTPTTYRYLRHTIRSLKKDAMVCHWKKTWPSEPLIPSSSLSVGDEKLMM